VLPGIGEDEEDAATAEISRTQIWQWIRHEDGKLEDGRDITVELFIQLLQEELGKLELQFGEELYKASKLEQAAELFTKLIVQDEFEEFLTTSSYKQLA